MAVHDLSSLADGINFGASQHAGNTVSDAPAFGAAGSPSEATADVDRHDTPEVTMPAQEDYARFEHSGADDAFAAHGWQAPQVDGDGWHGTRP
jgi:hypothetical protein